jgi:hypothetical protein
MGGRAADSIRCQYGLEAAPSAFTAALAGMIAVDKNDFFADSDDTAAREDEVLIPPDEPEETIGARHHQRNKLTVFYVHIASYT